MKITRTILEKKLDIFKKLMKGKFNNAELDYYALGGGYRIMNGDSYGLYHSRLSAGQLAIALDMVNTALAINMESP